MVAEYLEFKEWPNPGKKTRVYGVYSKRSGILLGTIRWHGAWRYYTLRPESNTIWNPTCLEQVCAKIEALMRERKEEQRVERAAATA